MIRRPPRSTLFPLHDALPIYAFQAAVLCAVGGAAGHSGHSLRHRLDHAGEPQDRHRQSGAATGLRHRCGVLRCLHVARHDVGGRHPARAHRVSLDERGVPADGSVARRIGALERRLDRAGGADSLCRCVAHDELHQCHGREGRRHPAGAAERPAGRPAGRRPLLLVQHHRLDDVELALYVPNSRRNHSAF